MAFDSLHDPSAPPLRPGRALRGTYAVEAVLGEGGLGAVCAARRVRTGTSSAVKVLHPDRAPAPSEVARLRREAELLARLRHPGIVSMLGVDVDEAIPFLVTDLAPGGTLASRLAAEGAVPWHDARRWALQVCDALQFAHGRGAVHRDVKPANVLLTHAERARGLAREAKNHDHARAPRRPLALTSRENARYPSAP